MAQKITIRELVTKFIFATDRAGLSQYAGIMSGVKNGLDLLKGVASTVGGALRSVTTDVVELGDTAGETADSLGLTAESLQELEGVAKFSGAANETLTAGLKNLSKTTEAFVAGGGAAKDVLTKMGLSARQLAGIPLDERLSLVADAFDTLPPGAEQTTAALRLFGGAGLDMVRVLRQGGTGIKNIRAEMRSYGIVSNETAALAGTVNDNLDRLSFVARGAKIEIGAQLLPAVNEIAEGMVAFYRANKAVIGQGLTSAVKAISSAMAALRTILGPVVRLMSDLVDPTKEADKRLSALDKTLVLLRLTLGGFGLVIGVVKFQGIISGAKALLLLIPPLVAGIKQFGVIATLTQLFAGLRTGALAAWAAVYAGPIAIASLIGGLALLYDDISKFIDGEDSLIGRFVARFKTAEGYLGDLAATFQYLFRGSGLQEFVAFFEDSFDSLEERIAAFIRGLKDIPVIGGLLGGQTPGAAPPGSPIPAVATPTGSPRMITRSSTITVGEVTVNANNAGSPEEVGAAVSAAIEAKLSYVGRSIQASDDDGEGRRG